MRKDLNQDTERAQSILRFDHLRYLLQSSNNLVVHRGLLQRNTDIDAKLVAQGLGLHMITGACNHSVIKHFLDTLMHRCATHAALFRHIFERDACTLSNNLEDFTI